MLPLARSSTLTALLFLTVSLASSPAIAQTTTTESQATTSGTEAVKPFPAPGGNTDSAEGFKDPFASGSDGKTQGKIELSDPLEPWNRTVMSLNRLGFNYVGEPAARAYRNYTPQLFRDSMRRFFHNLYEPTYTLNSLLQGEWHDAGVTSRRFVINTTFGIGGLFDPAGEHLKPVERDFDQTLGHWDVPPGFYLVWPLIGPSSPRGTVGYVVDGTMDPLNYVGTIEETSAATTYRIIHQTSYQIGQFEALDKFTVDQYSAIKNYYETQLYKKSQR